MDNKNFLPSLSISERAMIVTTKLTSPTPVVSSDAVPCDKPLSVNIEVIYCRTQLIPVV